jgi:hypothetical protein
MRRSAKEVFDDHLERRKQGDLRRNYAEDVAVLTARGVLRGHDGVRRSAALLYEAIRRLGLRGGLAAWGELPVFEHDVHRLLVALAVDRVVAHEGRRVDPDPDGVRALARLVPWNYR